MYMIGMWENNFASLFSSSLVTHYWGMISLALCTSSAKGHLSDFVESERKVMMLHFYRLLVHSWYRFKVVCWLLWIYLTRSVLLTKQYLLKTIGCHSMKWILDIFCGFFYEHVHTSFVYKAAYSGSVCVAF